jgi:hypothetical protein
VTAGAMNDQMDLFADTDTKLRDERRAMRAEWDARFVRRWFTAAYDTQGAVKTGDKVHGWVCPACGEVEWSPLLLSINHGYDPERPGLTPFSVEFGAACSSRGRMSAK